jgi:hypothetical protein
MPESIRIWRAEETQPAKRYLMEYRVLVQRRDALLDELERLRETTLRATAHISPARPSGRTAHDAAENGMLRVVDAEERLCQVIRHIGEALDVRLVLIEQITDERQKTLLTLRYINGMGWESIGYEMHYERTQVFEIHTQALQAVQKALDAPANGNRLQTGNK